MVTIEYSDGSSITLDATLSERLTARVTLTKFPIEKGMKPSDSATRQPDALSIEGVFTNLPLDDDTLADRGAGSGFVKQMVDVLLQTLDDREGLTVITEMRRYENMVMTGLSMPRTAEIGEAVQFSADFEQVRFVNTQTVQLAPKQTSVPQKPTQKDKQGTKVAQPASEAQNRSAAKAISDWAGFSSRGSGAPGG